MDLDRARAYPQIVRDRLVRQPCQQPLEHLALTRREQIQLGLGRGWISSSRSCQPCERRLVIDDIDAPPRRPRPAPGGPRAAESRETPCRRRALEPALTDRDAPRRSPGRLISPGPCRSAWLSQTAETGGPPIPAQRPGR